MFEKKYLKFHFTIILSLIIFIGSLKTNPALGGFSIILLMASQSKCDNKNIVLMSKGIAVIITVIIVYFTFIG